MKYYIIAGEASGDLHASNMMKQILFEDASADFRFWGGDRMQKVGGELVKHYKDLAFMGFVEVVQNLSTILKNISFCKKDIESYQPDALILVDYPGFNLRIAEWAKAKGFKVYYYISPQIWAWKQSRVHKIKRVVDKMFCILPFEKDFYKKFDYDAEFVGHPLLDAIQSDIIEDAASIRNKYNFGSDKIVLLLPGSRKQEIEEMLKVMVKVAVKNANYRFVIAAVKSISPEFYKAQIGDAKIEMITGDTYSLLSVASAAMVTSGTATLETALFEVPEVVCYKGGKISYEIAKRLIKVKYISLVNLILDRPCVAELIQDDMNVERLNEELKKVLEEGAFRNKMLADYNELKLKLGGGGASKKVAQSIVNDLQK
jgi:lipid-A-disaccharide synthase